ncbi:FHA domain-containing protein [Myxococcaceae bacterium GXIMD 01537]
MELPFDDDEVMPLQADDPRPQRVPQFPAGTRRRARRLSREGGRDRELSPRFGPQDYSDPGYAPAFLYVERGPGAGQLVPVKQGPLVLGRASSSDLRLQHPSISRRHAQLVRQGERFTLRDLNSQNGTFVNRTRISTEVALQVGDEIALGNALLRLRGSSAPAELAAQGVTVSPPSRRRGRGMGLLRVAFIAAAVGSAVAALITLAVVRFTTPPGEVTAAPPEETPAPDEAHAAEDPRPTPLAAPVVKPPPPERPRTTARTHDKELSAQAVALASQAKGAGGRRADSASAPRAEDVLARYEAGEVAEALALARKAKLEPLAGNLAAFEAAETAGQKALAANDTRGAMEHLAAAFKLDLQLSKGWSPQGRELRKQLGNLHTATGIERLRAEDTAAARESFERALQYDPANAQAKSHLGRLGGASSAP